MGGRVADGATEAPQNLHRHRTRRSIEEDRPEYEGCRQRLALGAVDCFGIHRACSDLGGHWLLECRRLSFFVIPFRPLAYLLTEFFQTLYLEMRGGGWRNSVEG